MSSVAEIGARIRSRRLERGLSLYALADRLELELAGDAFPWPAIYRERAGASVSHLARIERGERLPTIPTVWVIARALECRELELLEGSEPLS